jgi:hypothetical protein
MLEASCLNKRIARIATATVIGLVLVAGAIWALARALDEGVPRFQGQPLDYWVTRANSPDAAVSNQACLVLLTKIIPQLTDTMFHDTNDSRLKLALVEQLNHLPGIHIFTSTAASRRFGAAESLGQIGPLAKATIPDLIKVLKGKAPAPRPAAALALGRIQSAPKTIMSFRGAARTTSLIANRPFTRLILSSGWTGLAASFGAGGGKRCRS